MRYSFASLIRRTRESRRNQIALRDIIPSATLATDPFRAAYLFVIQTWERVLPQVLAEFVLPSRGFRVQGCAGHAPASHARSHFP